jgi:surface carbohydrate biosynthesis protein (TIGR04326 family)
MKNTYVLHAGDTKKVPPKMLGRPFSWLYLGKDITQRENIAKTLGENNRYFIGDLLQKVAHEQKEPYLSFIAELGFQQKDRLQWWASNMSYKNPILQHDLFLLWCYDVLFNKVCHEGKKDQEKSLLVFVEDRWLYRHFWDQNQDTDSVFHFLSRKSVLLEILGAIMRGIAERVYSLTRMVYYAWQSRNMGYKYGTANDKENKTKVYIYSWVQDRFFGEDGDFHDAYFGKLPEMLTDNSIDVAYITPLLLSPILKRKCLDYGRYKFTFLDRHIRFTDILKSLFTLFRISCGTQQQPLMTLLQRQFVYEISSVPVNLIHYFAFKRWLQEIDQGEITIIYPFENQPWEKMLCMAAREVNKKCNLVGYQHTTVPSLLLNYFLGTGESNNMPLPHIIVTNGEHTLNLLRNAGYGDVEFINGGALRYERPYRTDSDSTKRRNKVKTVLVAFPYSASQSQEMLLAVLNAFREMEKIRIIMKPHPAVPLERLAIQVSAWPVNFEMVDKPVPEILKEVDLLIYSASTTGLEASLAGIPVVKYYSEHLLDLDPLDTVDGSSVRSCSENNMKHVVLSALDEKRNHPGEKPTSSPDKFFSPVNEDVWTQIVKHRKLIRSTGDGKARSSNSMWR